MGVAGPFTGEAGGRRGKLMVGVAALCRRLSPNGSQSHPVSLWHKRDFVLLWFGQTVSILGSRMSELAIPLLVLAVTHSPVKAGVAGFVGGLPRVIFQLPAGAWVDRWDRRRVMIVCDLGRLMVIISIPVMGVTLGISYTQLLISAFAHTTLSVFFVLAYRAALIHIVDSKARSAAIALNQANIQGAMMVGAPVGGLLFGLSRTLPFIADGASYLISLITLIRLRTRLQAPPLVRVGRLHHDIAAGIRLVWNDRCLRALSLVSAALSLLISGVPLVVIVLATHRGASPSLIGMVLGIGGIGGLLGAVLAPYLVRKVPAGNLIVTCLWLETALILAIGLVDSAVALGPILAGLTVLSVVLIVVAQTRRARLVPNQLLGRVYSISMLISTGTAPLGSLLAGWLLFLVGPIGAAIILGASLGVVAVAASNSHTVRHADLPQPEEPHSTH